MVEFSWRMIMIEDNSVPLVTCNKHATLFSISCPYAWLQVRSLALICISAADIVCNWSWIRNIRYHGSQSWLIGQVAKPRFSTGDVGLRTSNGRQRGHRVHFPVFNPDHYLEGLLEVRAMSLSAKFLDDLQIWHLGPRHEAWARLALAKLPATSSPCNFVKRIYRYLTTKHNSWILDPRLVVRNCPSAAKPSSW